MSKKLYLPILIILLVGFSVKAQNEVGGYTLTSWTGQIGSPNANENSSLYSKKFTMSKGFGVNFIHFYKGKKDTRKHSRYGYRIDLVYTGQSQKWTTEYRKTGVGLTTHEGQLRLDYLKLNPMFEVSHPYSKHVSLIMFAGPQLGYLIDNDGGLIAYRRLENSDYFDLPVQNNGYFRKFTLGAAGGIGIDYEFTKWINLSGGIRADFSLTGVDKPNEVINGTKLFNLDEETSSSRNYNIALFLGAEYTLHRPEHAKTRF